MATTSPFACPECGNTADNTLRVAEVQTASYSVAVVDGRLLIDQDSMDISEAAPTENRWLACNACEHEWPIEPDVYDRDAETLDGTSYSTLVAASTEEGA